MAEARTSGRSIVCELQTGEKYLYGEIQIECPECGPILIRIPGHHMRAMLRLLAEWVDENPALTGVTDLREIDRVKFTGKTGGDPTAN